MLALASISLAFPATHTCRPVADAFKIDGVLDDAGWQGLDTLRLLRNNDPAGGKPSAETKVLVAWSATRLYVAYIADGKNVKNTVTKHDDDGLYEQDVVELFLDPDGDGKNYFELEWNCLNTSLDFSFTSPLQGRDVAWAPKGMQSAVKVHGTANNPADTDTGMVVEISLPWEGFAAWSKSGLPPKAGDNLPLNFYRIIYSSPGVAELISWTSTGAPSFHMPEKFGSLVFSSQPVTSLLPERRAGIRTPAVGNRAARRADGKLYTPPVATRPGALKQPGAPNLWLFQSPAPAKAPASVTPVN